MIYPEISYQVKEVEPQAFLLSVKDKPVLLVIGEKIGWHRLFPVYQGKQMAIEPVVISLAAASRAPLCIMKASYRIPAKVVLLP